MPDKPITSGPPLTRKKYTPAFEAECVRQVTAGARQTDVACAQGFARFVGTLAALGPGPSRTQQCGARRD